MSKRWNVAKLTSEISSSPRKVSNGTVFGDGKSPTGITATAPLAVAAKEAPVIPSTDTALLERLRFEARFACGMAEFLLVRFSNKYAQSPVSSSALA
ncbi:MAG TPA: hypothetical protein VME69_14800 [Methylocella sp.]|nr:hypothetical protein [Methylocella sp.]